MSSTIETTTERQSHRGEPTWEVAYYYPFQGQWTEWEFLKLDRMGRRLIELSDGCVELLPRPTWPHYNIVRFLYKRFREHVEENRLGEVFSGPMPVHLGPGKYRTPDVMFFRPERIRINRDGQPEGMDLAVEVLGPTEAERHRDFVVKREEYAQAGISEYWAVDPENHLVHVLTLTDATENGVYREHGVFRKDQVVTGILLPGLTIAIEELFAAGKPYLFPTEEYRV